MSIVTAVAVVTVIGLLGAAILVVAAHFMHVEEDPRVGEVLGVLPGANCGACGFSGCDGYAAAVAAGEATPDKCAPGGAAAAAALAEILGVEVVNEPKIAFIACKGTRENTKLKYAYSGMQSCAAAAALQSGPLECSFGCLGFGDCAAVCPFGAITLENGRPAVCGDICVGCGKCVSVCPKALISVLPKSAGVRVACSNKEKGAPVVKNCSVSCIACKMCEKVCESGAVKVIDNLAVIDRTLCTGCGKCKAACKRGVII